MKKGITAGPRRGKGSILGSSFKVTLIKIISSLLAMGGVMLVAYKFGAGALTDSLFTGRIIPLMLSAQVCRSLSVGLVPIFTRVRISRGDEACKQLLIRLLVAMGLVLAALIGLYYLITPFAIGILGIGLNPEMRDLGVIISRILMVSVFFMGTHALVEAFLNVHRIFLVPEMAAAFFPLGTIAGVLLLTGRLGIVGIPIGTLAGSALSCLTVLVFAHLKFRFPHIFSLSSIGRELRELFKQTAPVLYGDSAAQIANAVSKALATTLGAGRVSILNYSYRMVAGFPFVWGLALGKVLLPHLAEQAAGIDRDHLRASVGTFLRVMLAMFIFYSLLLIMLRLPLIWMLFGRGAFNAADVARTASVVVFYAPAICFGAVNLVVMRTFFSLQKNAVIFITSSVFLLASIALCILLMPYMDLQGLALAYTLAAFCRMVLSIFLLERQIGRFLDRDILIFLGKIILAAALAMTPIGASLGFFDFAGRPLPAFVYCAAGGVLSGGLYLLALYFLRVPEMALLISRVRRRIGGAAGTGE